MSKRGRPKKEMIPTNLVKKENGSYELLVGERAEKRYSVRELREIYEHAYPPILFVSELLYHLEPPQSPKIKLNGEYTKEELKKILEEME